MMFSNLLRKSDRLGVLHPQTPAEFFGQDEVWKDLP